MAACLRAARTGRRDMAEGTAAYGGAVYRGAIKKLSNLPLDKTAPGWTLIRLPGQSYARRWPKYAVFQ